MLNSHIMLMVYEKKKKKGKRKRILPKNKIMIKRRLDSI